jgi:hypothetical protein
MKTALLAAVFLFALGSRSAIAASIPEIVAASKPSIVKIIAFNAEGHAIKGGTGFFISADGLVATNLDR